MVMVAKNKYVQSEFSTDGMEGTNRIGLIITNSPGYLRNGQVNSI